MLRLIFVGGNNLKSFTMELNDNFKIKYFYRSSNKGESFAHWGFYSEAMLSLFLFF